MEHGLSIAWRTVLKMVDGFFALLPNLIIALGVFIVFNIISRVLERIASNMSSRARFDRTLSTALGKLVSVLTNVFALLVCASIVVPSFSPDKLIAGLGITSVAIGFAFQNILQNFFAGMLLLWQKPFGIGDEIKSKDYEGTVEDITIRTTLLRTYTGERVYIPNGLLFTDPVIVNTAFASRQVHLEIPCGKIPPGTAVELAKNAVKNLSTIAKDRPPEVYLAGAGSDMTLDVYLWAPPQNTQIIKAKDEATYAIHNALEGYRRAQKQAKAA